MTTTIVIQTPQWPIFTFVVLAMLGTPVLVFFHFSKPPRGEEDRRAAQRKRALAFTLFALAAGLWAILNIARQEGALRVTLGADAAVFDYRFSAATVGYRDVTHLEYRDRKGSRGSRIHEVRVTTPTGTQRVWAESPKSPKEVAAVREVFDQLSARVPKDRITTVVAP